MVPYDPPLPRRKILIILRILFLRCCQSNNASGTLSSKRPLISQRRPKSAFASFRFQTSASPRFQSRVIPGGIPGSPCFSLIYRSLRLALNLILSINTILRGGQPSIKPAGPCSRGFSSRLVLPV
ncbi:hypothetical protein BDZ45DRAFT_347737 [Acephala macrosclerotiorum]|nr:hypothetical protein BDZ45DRAFT_347737 [Acephala macrosclerotiorum]